MIEHMLILLYLQCCLNFVLLIVIKYNKLSQNTQKKTVPPVIPHILLWHHWFVLKYTIHCCHCLLKRYHLPYITHVAKNVAVSKVKSLIPSRSV